MFLFVFLAILTSGLYARSGDQGVRQVRKVKEFSGISVNIPADVVVKQGPVTEVVLEGPEHFLEKVETVVEGGVLRLRFYRKYSGHHAPEGRIRVEITVPEMERVYVTGSATVKAAMSLSVSGAFRTVVTGSGSVEIDRLRAEKVRMSVTGSGSIRIAGAEVEEAEVMITGSGRIRAEGLPARTAKVNITGSGDAWVQAEEDLKVMITGSGNLHYRGSAVVDARITGSGKLIRMD